MITEKEIKAPNGIMFIFVLLASQIGAFTFLVSNITNKNVTLAIIGLLVTLVIFICWFGFFMVNPKEARVMQLFGKYAGTVHDSGLRWANPFYTKMRVSLRVRNFESSKLKVNDKNGNPIEIAAVIVWEVTDTAEAVFQVDDYEDFVSIQSESALRNLATSYAYDHHEDDDISLRSDPTQISAALKVEVQDRLEKAGVTVIESRISHLAYAPEIANAMLRRQQAMAIIAARRTIVEGAVGMVEMALTKLEERQIVELDAERKAAMVSNLLVVLCSDEAAQPIVNTGSLY
ncbi:MULTISPECIES: SPFH domain-containing protein [unclassified Colwellia]|uniref:SPFH domain-containing protein n=1 Tax=unclassified Colwellia TaxID=196834 RepID=UPI0015F5656B|nr:MULTISPECIES: SPFH domain-containing protein [unclassified Colwellia]MBA6234456.1 SPFH domain-containing protein [Colwellia sp. MB02u-7]MBA6236877.1 SPFH domain-containing protein [Colwellia sp. MB02u-11]MBA6256180.1 SPFH domain-containing protein [Colwellia sp. MB3u-28]MBA6260064.1 SPFH domain-containing protein [Colwellia sp. MB3u-41]MBA6299983.1 SPFH domain-containing protein [Colwellia sp. MB3u-22]